MLLLEGHPHATPPCWRPSHRIPGHCWCSALTSCQQLPLPRCRDKGNAPSPRLPHLTLSSTSNHPPDHLRILPSTHTLPSLVPPMPTCTTCFRGLQHCPGPLSQLPRAALACPTPKAPLTIYQGIAGTGLCSGRQRTHAGPAAPEGPSQHPARHYLRVFGFQMATLDMCNCLSTGAWCVSSVCKPECPATAEGAEGIRGLQQQVAVKVMQECLQFPKAALGVAKRPLHSD
jgi:hypothetical protein